MNKRTKDPLQFQEQPLQQPLTIWHVVQKGMDFAKSSFWLVVPFCFLMTTLVYGYGVQPQTIPTISDWSDVISLLLMALGLWTLSALHASALIQMNSSLQNRPLSLKNAMQKGIRRSLPVFIVCLLYFALMALAGILFVQTKNFGETTLYPEIFPYVGLVFILPVLLLSVSFYLSLFIVVLARHKKETPVYRKIIDYFHESVFLLSGSWWKMLGLMLLNFAVMTAIWGVYQLLLKELVVCAVLFYLVTTSIVITFWYGCVLALILELKAKKMEKLEMVQPAI